MTSPGAATAAAPADAERLTKLWDAYRAQEEEYQEALARVERLTHDLEARGQDVVARERALHEKDAEIARLRDAAARKDAQLARLAELEEDAKAIQAYKDRIAELEGALAREKERLAKLFLLYEEATRPAGR